MIKLVFCVRRRADLSVSEFRKLWSEHQTHTRAVAKALKAVKLTHSLALAIEWNAHLMLTRGTAEPFDGVIEVWWHDSSQFTAAMQDPHIEKAVQELRSHQKEFVDLSGSMIFFAKEEYAQEF